MQLWNTLSKEDLEIQLKESGYSFVTVSFYQYAHIENPLLFRNQLFMMWSTLNIVGRTYVAKEGINAQISIPVQNFQQFRDQLYEIEFLRGIRLNIAVDDANTDFSFLKLKS